VILKLDLGLCRDHYIRFRLPVLIGIAGFILAAICFALGLALKDVEGGFEIMIFSSVAIFSVGAVLFQMGRRRELVTYTKFENSYFWLSGFGPEYLDLFPRRVKVPEK